MSWVQAGSPSSQPLAPCPPLPVPLSTQLSCSTWGSWAGPDHDKFSAMKYEQGTGCWQGPNRSTTVSTRRGVAGGTQACQTGLSLTSHLPQVRLLCGRETVVTSTTEPSRCEYLMELTTPAACPEPPPEPPTEGDHDEL